MRSNLKHTTGRNCCCRGVFPRRLCRLSEIYRNQTALRNTGYKICCYFSGCIQIFLLLRMTVAQCKSINSPCLSSGPGRTYPISLSTYRLHKFTCLCIEVYNMIDRTIISDKIFHGCICMHLSHMIKFRVMKFITSPIQ